MDLSGLSRRRVLTAVGAVGVGGLAGCSSEDDVSSGVATERPSAGTESESPTATPGERTAGDTPEQQGEQTAEYDHYVAPDGSDDAAGTPDAPLATIGAAIERVQPGERIYAASGEYQEFLRIGTSGTASEPIEITGPPDAVLRRRSDEPVAAIIGGDHVHITGLSITGLSDPSRPEDPDAYADAPLVMATSIDFETYNRGALVAPHRIGGSGAQLVKFRFCRDAEAGPFRVVGRAGAAWQLTGSGHPSGEIVYVGTSPSTIEKASQVNQWDRTRNVRVHHIDNSAGHPHNQLVDIKPGTENVTVEYCTDGGGSHNNKDWAARSIAIRGHAATVRWNRLQDGENVGIGLGSGHNNDPQNEVQERAGENNEIYGNEIIGFGQEAISFPWTHDGPGQAPEDQAVYCGNLVDGEADGDAEQSCPTALPQGDGIGHTGGDSPYPT